MAKTSNPLIRKIGVYLSLVKFSHTVFAMPFAFIGFTLGVTALQGRQSLIDVFSFPLLVKMVLCMVFARSAAMAFNRYLDRRFDALNPRTAAREIPAGVVKPESALAFTIANCLLFVTTTFFINTLCFYLSFVALAVVLFYSYTKRFTALCHVVLGIGLALSPIGAFLSVTGVFHLLPLLFSFSVLTWVSGFDIIYALQDQGFDQTQELHSIPVWLGIGNALKVSTILHALSFGFVFWAGCIGGFHWVYWIGVAFYGSMLVYQHLLVKPTDLSKVNMAFANTNGMASVVFASCTIAAILLR